MATSSQAVLSFLLAVVMMLEHQPTPVAAEVDIWQEIVEIEIFKLKGSAEGCPVWLQVMSCPQASIFVYYKCCGWSCCRRFQGWVLGLIGLVIALYVLRSLIKLFQDIFCCRYRQWKKEQRRNNRRRERSLTRTNSGESDEEDSGDELLEVVPSSRASKPSSGDGVQLP